MGDPKPDRVSLSQAERTEVEALVRRHGTPQQLALRGRIILAATEGKNNSQIARELGICVDTVRHWRTRWIGLQAISLQGVSVSERLEDVPRPGRPSQITAKQTCQMIALAGAQPKERPISHWTGRQIADARHAARHCEADFTPTRRPSVKKKGISTPISSAIG